MEKPRFLEVEARPAKSGFVPNYSRPILASTSVFGFNDWKGIRE
jgi:hypothetical protein